MPDVINLTRVGNDLPCAAMESTYPTIGDPGNIERTLKMTIRLSPVPLKKETDRRPNLPLFAPACFC